MRRPLILLFSLATLCISANTQTQSKETHNNTEISDANAVLREPTVDVCDETNAPGRSMVYCKGRLLEAVNRLMIFNDAKTFVDRPIKENYTGKAIMDAFDKQFPGPIVDSDNDTLNAFVDKYFDLEGQELQECQLSDWSQSPKSFDVIMDSAMKGYAKDLNDIWKKLCRKVKSVVKDHSERFSFLYVENNFIIPGGRFREYYYWDTYWIIRGLLASEMTETARGMIQNFASIVTQYGFIPNGGRVYYLKRSQPPLLTAMVYEYYQATRNQTFLNEMLPVLEQEYLFFSFRRSVNVQMNGKTYSMFHYRTESNVPRPESYREDIATAAKLTDETRKQQLYRELGSTAESGWDFSSRWFLDKKTLTTVHTTEIVPVDLNAFICYNQRILSFLYGETGNTDKEAQWRNLFISFRDDFQQVFYVKEDKGWYDYDLNNGTHNTAFYPSNAVPLFAGCYDILNVAQAEDAVNRMEEQGAFGFIGGVPTSLDKEALQQWDYPNGWGALNHMIIEGLRKSGSSKLQQKAFVLAQKWVTATYKVWKDKKVMWEKYDVVTDSGGGGGEYDDQTGFGMTNGGVLGLLLSYGDRLTDNSGDSTSTPAPSVQTTTNTIATTNCLPLISLILAYLFLVR